MRDTAPSSHWRISAPRIACGAPDRRSPHFSTIATSHWLPPKASRYTPPPKPYLPFGSNPSPPPPPPILPYAPDSLLSPPPFIPARAFWTLPVTLPVTHTFHFGSPSTAYTGPVIHCLPPCSFRPSSVPQTSVSPGLLIPSAFYTPLPTTTSLPHPHPYLTHKTPPTLTHWWFSTWGAQSHHPTDGSPPLTHQPINLHLPTP